jgi:glycosyltransferase involved in cell wall biosynthesis
MKRVLWVTAIAPCFDAGGGGEIRQAQLLDALAERFEVRLLLAGRLHDERVRARTVSVHEVPVALRADPPRMRRRLRDIRWQMIDRQPDEVARQKHVRQALGQVLGRLPEPDIVCVEYIGLARLLPRKRSALWSLTLHNLTSQMARHSAVIAPGRRQQLMLALQGRNSRRLEQWAVGAYDLAITPSPDDAAMLPPGVVVVPNGVDTARFRPTPPPVAPRVVFTGALHTVPNRDGIAWFCAQIWPVIRARIPDATLEIVGARPPDDVLALAAREGISVHPDVPDVVPFLKRAAVAVVPLRIGTGSRLKVLEAMAAGRPVVGTSIGVGGLEAEAGRDLLVADGAAMFADAVVRCLSDRELAARLTARARVLVEERYAWTRIGSDYSFLLEERAAALSTSSDAIATNRLPIRPHPKRRST